MRSKRLLMALWITVLASCRHQTTDMHAGVHFTAQVSTITQQLGDTRIKIKTYNYGRATDVVMINVHSDEFTSVNAATRWLQQHGGMLIKIENGNNRNIRFTMEGEQYEFDPNHIFTKQAIIDDLQAYQRYSPQAVKAVQQLSKKLLHLIPPEAACIVALHNNSDGKYGIDDYLEGGKHCTDAVVAKKHRRQDPDDIFFTTDKKLFGHLSEQGFNTILQDVNRVRNKGTMSVYFHKKNMRYLNCETEHGKVEQYTEMLARAMEFVRK